MWFENTRKRRFPRRRRNRSLSPVLQVRAGKGKRRTATGRLPVILLVIAVVAGLGFLGWMGVRAAGRLLYSRNELYAIRHLSIVNGGVVTRDFVCGKMGIVEGSNLFGFSIREVRNRFLQRAHNYKSMEIQRLLPDTLVVEVVERVPIAKLGRRGGLVVDRDGFVFGLRSLQDRLPAIVGYRGQQPQPGARVEGLSRDALRVLDMCERTQIGREVQIAEIDVSGGFRGQTDSLRVKVDRGPTVDLWWHRRKQRGLKPEDDLHGRLVYLRGVLRSSRQSSRPLRTVNLTMKSYQQNCTVEHIL